MKHIALAVMFFILGVILEYNVVPRGLIELTENSSLKNVTVTNATIDVREATNSEIIGVTFK